MTNFQKKVKEAYENPDFYGERLITPTLPENAFSLLWSDKENKVYIIPYKKQGKDLVDSSIYSYAHFSPITPDKLIFL